MRNLGLVRAALLSVSMLALWPASAFAQDDAAPPEAAPPPPPPPGAVLVPIQQPQNPDDYKHFAVVLNPLATTIGRYSIQGEWLPAMHHALTLNPYYTHATITVDNVDEGSLSGFGGELGYRYYTGSKGPNGFFVGPSVLFGSYSQSYNGSFAGTNGNSSFTSVGGAIDIGGQGVVGPGIVIGGGFGLQWTKTSKDIGSTDGLNLASAIIAGGGTRPRFLFTVGYAF